MDRSCDAWDPAFDSMSVHSEKIKERPECKYTSFVRRQCRLEGQKDSDKLAKRCQKLTRCFRDCGSGREEIETSLEDYIDQSYERSDGAQLTSSDIRSSGAETIPVVPLTADFGNALRDFQNYADGLKHRNMQGPSRSRNPANNISGGPTQGLADYSTLSTPWYARLFSRQAQCSPGRQRPWDQYKDDFKEV